MNIALRSALTVDDYLAWAAAQPEAKRTELINGQIVFMSPEQVQHNRLKGAVYMALRRAVADQAIEAEAFTDGVTIPIDTHTAYEPDASVRLGPPLPGREMEVPDPVIVVEVISPTSAHSDTSAKLIGYFKLPSVHHYLVIDPDTRTVTHHKRGADGRISTETMSSGPLRLDPPGITIDTGALVG
ncbi:MAG: hypothetical protein QOF14_4052 [Hyphomicrobiales bacterium]|jgi:Uma2 family endonuclease|nr:hypothetical protein [Hyphomicrobiales bacterium]